MYSNCCGAEASYLSDEICGDCLEHAVFERNRRIDKTDMKKIIDKFLIKRSIRPYKTVALSTGVIVEHYRNGKLKTEYYGLV
jgi:hypothetical protein